MLWGIPHWIVLNWQTYFSTPFPLTLKHIPIWQRLPLVSFWHHTFGTFYNTFQMTSIARALVGYIIWLRKMNRLICRGVKTKGSILSHKSYLRTCARKSTLTYANTNVSARLYIRLQTVWKRLIALMLFGSIFNDCTNKNKNVACNNYWLFGKDFWRNFAEATFWVQNRR